MKLNSLKTAKFKGRAQKDLNGTLLSIKEGIGLARVHIHSLIKVNIDQFKVCLTNTIVIGEAICASNRVLAGDHVYLYISSG